MNISPRSAQVLDWSIQQVTSSGSQRHFLGFVCDVAALWLQRTPPGAAHALVPCLPRLLEAMARCPEDPWLLQHGCRLLWALAVASQDHPWPPHLTQPALKALEQLELPAVVRHYHAMAIRMLKNMAPSPNMAPAAPAAPNMAPAKSTAKSVASLDSMD